jgi:putative N6-adenine-specific DNA methylase
MVAKTLAGMEEILAQELRELGARDVEPQTRAVLFTGDTELMYKCNLHLRTALRILKPIDKFYAYDFDRLYKTIKNMDWSQYLSIDKTFAIDSVTFGSSFKHSHFTSLKVKDAIVDYFREKTGERPSVDRDNPDIFIGIHIVDHQCTVSLDSSGKPLDKRGYKLEISEAPLSEVLAAGLILSTGWDKITPFTDPMCGSGTIAIEAALIAANIAPGKFRHFIFEKWPDFNQELWEKIKRESLEQEIVPENKILAADLNMQSSEITRRNAHAAGLDDIMEIKNMDFFQSFPKIEEGIMVMNPPYGERLEHDNDMNELYGRIGTHLKHNYHGFNVWILSGNLPALKNIGLKTSRRLFFLNGSIECKFHLYNLYAGSKKHLG